MNEATPTLFAPAETVRAIAEARMIVVLLGGYDGSGNYGDIALLEATLDLLGRLGPDLLILPLLERSALEDHRALVAQEGQGPSQPIFFDPSGAIEDDLLPVGAPAQLEFGACYLYGGGYLNRSWGDRKLTMLRAAEALLTGAGNELCRLSSGLQADAGWIAELDEADAKTLRSFEFLGVRDCDSGHAMETLGSPAPVTGTADDAIGVLRRLAATNGSAAPNGRLHLNVHFAEHEWVSERPQAVLEFYGEFMTELGRLSNRPVVAQPVIAYLDRRTDERSGLERLRAISASLGVEVTEPLVLRPAALPETAPRLVEASLTLSCSYHVALTSLMLGVPAVLLGDNAYYAQKAAGLAADFELPPAFTPTVRGDAAALARTIAEPLLDPDGAAAFRRHIAIGASRLRRQRAATEVELLGRLGGAAATALAGRNRELAERLRQRSTEPAELRVRLAAAETELEALRRRAGESPLEAELRIQKAEAHAADAHRELGAILGSRSWRLLGPPRWLGALLRRLLGAVPGR